MLKNYSPQRAQRTRRILIGLTLGLWLLGGSLNLAQAQSTSNELQLQVHRTFGYGNGDQIQGLFTLEATGPELKSAKFMIGTELIGVVTSPPFTVRIDTDKYPHGFHTLTVTGETTDGRTLTSLPRRYEFVDAAVGNDAVLQIGGRIALVGFGLVAIIFAMQIFLFAPGKRRTTPLGAARRYGLKGGAICPKCGRPFGLHLLGVNLLTRYYDRCDHCGRWSLVARATPEELAVAEQAELKLGQPETPVAEETAEAKLKRQIDESKFTR
jgi:hypothetical protein